MKTKWWAAIRPMGNGNGAWRPTKKRVRDEESNGHHLTSAAVPLPPGAPAHLPGEHCLEGLQQLGVRLAVLAPVADFALAQVVGQSALELLRLTGHLVARRCRGALGALGTLGTLVPGHPWHPLRPPQRRRRPLACW